MKVSWDYYSQYVEKNVELLLPSGKQTVYY